MNLPLRGIRVSKALSSSVHKQKSGERACPSELHNIDSTLEVRRHGTGEQTLMKHMVVNLELS